jgi:hypothetical protein
LLSFLLLKNSHVKHSPFFGFFLKTDAKIPAETSSRQRAVSAGILPAAHFLLQKSNKKEHAAVPCSKTVFTKGRFGHNKAKAALRLPLPCNIRFSGKSHLKNHRHQKRSFQNKIIKKAPKRCPANLGTILR